MADEKIKETKETKEIKDDIPTDKVSDSFLKDIRPPKKVEAPSNIDEGVETKDNSDKIFIIIIVGILVAFGLFIGVKVFFPAETGYDEFTYNGFTFINVSDFWYVKIQMNKTLLHTIEFRNGPIEVENIPIQPGIKDRIENSKEIFLTIDPDLSSAAVVGAIEVARILGQKYQLYNIPTSSAMTREPYEGYSDENGSTKIITCENATLETLVIEFKLGRQNLVKFDGLCILVEGIDEDNIIKSSDKLAYLLAGVINED